MSAKINLKDGFCVSCGRESGVIYRSCPFCDEMVWHPLWRHILLWYMFLCLPLTAASALAFNPEGTAGVLKLYASASWPIQMLIALSSGALLLPYENRKLIHPSPKSRTLWLLNSLVAGIILLACVLLFSVSFRLLDSGMALRSLCRIAALTGAAAPLVMNCSWWRLLPAGILAAALIAVQILS